MFSNLELAATHRTMRKLIEIFPVADTHGKETEIPHRLWSLLVRPKEDALLNHELIALTA